MVLSTPTDEILELVFHADAILRSHGAELKVWLCNDQFPDLYSAGKAASEVFASDENWERLHSDVRPARPRKHYVAARPGRSVCERGRCSPAPQVATRVPILLRTKTGIRVGAQIPALPQPLG